MTKLKEKDKKLGIGTSTINLTQSSAYNEELQSANDLSNLLVSIEIPIVMVGIGGKIRRFTPSAGKLFKLIPSDIGRSIDDINTDISVSNLNVIINEVIANLCVKEIETQDRTGAWHKLEVRPYHTDDKNVVGAVITLIDIDLLKRNELEIKVAREDAESIIETMPIPLLVVCSNKKIKIANKSFYDKFQINKSDVEGRLIYEIIEGQWNIPMLLEILEKTLNENKEFRNFEVTHNFQKIGQKILLLNLKQIYLSGSKVSMALISIEDLTEIRQTDLKLKVSEEKYRNLLLNSYDGILVVKTNGIIEFVNPQLEKMFGYLPSELLNKNYEILVPEDQRKGHHVLHTSYMQKPVPRTMGNGIKISALKKDGSSFAVDISLSPFKTNNDFFVNCTVRDISVQKRLEEVRDNLQRHEKTLREEAEKLNRSKDEFLATLSHELRTPLTAILGWAGELQSEDLNKAEMKLGLEVIQRSALVQEQLINDLLDITRIQTGKLSLNKSELDLVKLLEISISAVHQIAEKKSIQIENKIPKQNEFKFRIVADEMRLQQVFWNLLTNAIKFTPEHGKITVSLELVETEGVQLAKIKITDTGIGIKPEFLPQIFQKFSQADSTSSRLHGGLGLGLAIARSLIEMQKGTIAAESLGEGKGATFILKFPLVTPAESKNKLNQSIEDQPLQAKRLDGLKILVVDDNVDNRVLFAAILKSLGAEVKLAESVIEAMEILKDYKPDLILSDISMPDLDGFSLLKKIRESTEDHINKLPVVALTAYAGAEDAERMLKAGFNAHVPKPINKIILSNTILKLVIK